MFTCMYFASKDPKILEKVINSDLKSATTWFSNNELLLNVDKCQVMLTGSKSNLSRFCNVDIRLNNKKLLRVMECKYLGILLDCNFSWNPQIDHVKKKVLKTYFALKRMRQFTDEKIALILYKTLIQPHFAYCSTIWMNGRETRLKQLQTLQNRCLRSVLGVNSRYHTEILYKTLEIDMLKEYWVKQALVTVFKLLHNLGPPVLSSLIQFNTNVGYMFRYANSQIPLPRPHTNFLQHSPLYHASKLFNTLPNDIRIINVFKSYNIEISKIQDICSLLSTRR